MDLTTKDKYWWFESGYYISLMSDDVSCPKRERVRDTFLSQSPAAAAHLTVEINK